MSKSNSHIELTSVSQSFDLNGETISLFEDLNFQIHQGHSYAITGPSGTGKSSLLMLMSGLEQAKSGKIRYHKGQHHFALSEIRESIGFIFQQFHLLPELTALHNVSLPLRLRGDKDAEDKAVSWLEKVGLGHRLKHRPQQLSGGEQQRVAIARALVFEPKFIFADEPTGNLDTNSALEISELLFSCSKDSNAGLVIVTHSKTLANQSEFIFSLKEGKCVDATPINREVA